MQEAEHDLEGDFQALLPACSQKFLLTDRTSPKASSVCSPTEQGTVPRTMSKGTFPRPGSQPQALHTRPLTSLEKSLSLESKVTSLLFQILVSSVTEWEPIKKGGPE